MTALESNSSRPISVDLPSSTDPAVAMRRSVAISEIPLALAIFHTCFRDAVVGAGRATLGGAGDSGRGDHLGHGARQRFHATGAGDGTDGAEPHGHLETGKEH